MKKQVSSKHPVIEAKIQKSLNDSVREGGYASIMSSLGASYFSPFAIALNASSSQIGILHALASLFPGFIKLKSSKLIERYSRKKIVLTGCLIQALSFLPLISLALLYYFNVIQNVIWLVIGIIALFYAAGSVTHPAWFSWMGSLVPDKERGRYFSRRNRIAGFFGVVGMIIGGLILNYSELFGYVMIGFSLLFFFSFIFRMFSLRLLNKQYEPRIKVRKKDYFSFFQFLKQAKESAFGRFVLFTGVFRIVFGIATPFWAVYLLRELNLSYIWFMAIVVSGVLFQLFWYPVLGKFSDRYGNVALLRNAVLFLAFVPFLWVFSVFLPLQGVYLNLYLFFIPQIVSGFGMAGFLLATNNYIYDSISNEQQTFGSAYFNFVDGIGMFLGAGIGSLLALLNISFMNPILFIILISGLGRFLVVAAGTKYLREVRHVKQFSKQFIFKEFDVVGGVRREVHDFRNFVDKVEHYI
ncbi:MAG: MFS transporter [Candidatus Nanoarchaeia archaeon]